MAGKIDLWVYVHWKGMVEPKCMGMLSVQQAKGRRAYSFSYDENWINSQEQFLLDPDIEWFTGPQYPVKKENFGVFLDSMPDNWGRMLMKRRAILQANEFQKPIPVLFDLDYLLGVHDLCRMGALRFKNDPNGHFLDNDAQTPAPPWASVRELQHGAALLESNDESDEVRKWLTMLIAPGSSLGGARPKANIIDEQGQLWIAKFPSQNDTIDKGAWEYLAYRLAVQAGIDMAECRIEKISGKFHTFFTKRFDRDKAERIHFASAMTMTGKNEELIRDESPSYLDIVEFIQFSGACVDDDLKQLWKRVVFNICVSNTDDHLRNHGFILTPVGWRLSPAFDINPSIDKDGLALNIDMDRNSLDIDLARSVGSFFRLDGVQMNVLIDEVRTSVQKWEKIAAEIGIPRNEQLLMKGAFRY
jgi:serine/threonine-protein kinase HipA